MIALQKAIENYIEIQSKDLVSLEKIDKEIDKVRKSEIERAWQKRLKQWRKLNK